MGGIATAQSTPTRTATPTPTWTPSYTPTPTPTSNHLADLAISMTASPLPARVGQNLTYTLTVSNNGPNFFVSATVTDTLPANATFVSVTSTGSCIAGAGNVTCFFPLGALGTSGTPIFIVVRPTAVGQITNTADVYGTPPGVCCWIDPNASNNTATVTTDVVTPKSFFSVPACRLVDTRLPDGPLGGPALVAQADRTFVLAGQCGIPPTARAVSINLVAVQPTDSGFLTVYAAGSTRPPVSTINYSAGNIRANNATVLLGVSGGVAVYCQQSAGTAHLVIDVNGYFE